MRRVPLSEHAVAVAMLTLVGWCLPMRIGREAGLYHRTSIRHWLEELRGHGRVECRHRVACGGGYEWRLTPAGYDFAAGPAPDGDAAPTMIRWNHRALAQALDMLHTITPPAGRVHKLGGKWQR